MGALKDALNGLDGNEAALKELATMEQEAQALTTERDGLKVTNSELTEAGSTSESKTNELTELVSQKDARIAELGGQVTEGTQTKEALVAMTKERDTNKKSLDDLETSVKTDIIGRLEVIGLKPDGLKERDLSTLRAMEEAAVASRGEGNTTGQLQSKGQGIGGGTGTGSGGSEENLTELDKAEVQMAGLRANPNGTKKDEKVIT